MNEISPLDISKLLEKERQKEVQLEKSLEEIKEKLSLCKGAILAYEHLLQGTPSNGTRFDKEGKEDKDNLSMGTFDNVSHLSNTKAPNTSQGKKKRAARATKAEMEHSCSPSKLRNIELPLLL